MPSSEGSSEECEWMDATRRRRSRMGTSGEEWYAGFDGDDSAGMQ